MKLKKYIALSLMVFILFLSVPAHALYRVTDFTGGCADCLDVIDGARLKAKTKPSYAIVTTTPEHATYPDKEFTYLWDSDAACSESVPDSIIPDTNASGGCWILLTPGQAADIVANSVNDTHIDWGTGADQVSAVDVPIGDAGGLITGTEVETALQENRGAINTNTAAVATSAGLATSLSDETGTGTAVFGTEPTFTTGIDTPAITSPDDLEITPAGGDTNINGKASVSGDLTVTGETTVGGLNVLGDTKAYGDIQGLFRKPRPRTLLSGFENTGWTTSDGDCTQTFESNEVTVPAVIHGGYSYLMDTGASTITCSTDLTISSTDLSGKDFSIAVNGLDNVNNVTTLKIKFTDGAGATGQIDNVADYLIYPYGLLDTSTVGVGEWQYVEFSPANVTGTACEDTINSTRTATCTKTGVLDWTDIVAITISLVNDDTKTVKVYFDQLEYFDSPPVGMYIVRIDHQDDGIYEDAREVFQANAITPQLAGYNLDGSATATLLSANQMKALRAMGWEWADHSRTHTPIYRLTADQVEADLVASRRHFIENGELTDGRFFVIPYGTNTQYSYTARDLVRKYYSRGFGYIGDGVGVWNQKNPEWTNGVIQWDTQAGYDTEFQQKIIDDVSTYGGQASFLIHEIDPTTSSGAIINVADLTTIMEYLSAKITSTSNTSNMIVNATYSEIEDLWNPDNPRQASHPNVVSRNVALSQSYYGHINSIKTIVEADVNFTAGDIKLLTTPINTTGTEIDYSGLNHDMTHTGTVTVNYAYEDFNNNFAIPESIFQPMTTDFGATEYLSIADHADFEIGDDTTDTEFSWCVWTEVVPTATGQGIIGKSIFGAGNLSWEAYIGSDELAYFDIFDLDTNNKLQKVSDTVLAVTHSTVGTTITNNLHHICGTYDPGVGAIGSSERIQIFIDGVEDSTGNDTETGTYVASHDDGSALYSGYNARAGWVYEGTESTTLITKGLALSPATISQLYNAGKYYYKPYE